MKRWAGVVFLALLTILSGCSGKNNGETHAQSAKTQTRLTLMLPQTHYKDFFQELLKQFALEYPEIKMEPQIIPDNQWTDVVKTKIAIRETPDLIRIDKGLLEDVGVKHFVEFDSAEPWYDRVRPEQLTNKMVEGKLYGLPVSSSTSLGVVYNRRVFEKYHLTVPKSFQQWVQVCQTLKANGIIPLYASDKDSWTSQIGFNSVAAQMTDEETWEDIKGNRLKWSEAPYFVSILEDLASLRWEGYTNSDYMEATYTSAVAAMAEEKAAMYIAGQFFISDVKSKNAEIDLMTFPVPYEKDILTMIDGPGQFSLFKDCENKEEAKAFLNWFSQPEHMDVFTSGWGHMPVFRDQKQPVDESQQALMDAYISQGKTVLEIDDVMTGVDMNNFWSYQQEMLSGVLEAHEVLEKWDVSFKEQMEEKNMPGWIA